MRRSTLVAASLLPVALLAGACAGQPSTEGAESADTPAPPETDWEPREADGHTAEPRLVVAAAESGTVSVFDLLSGDTVGTVEATGPARLTIADPDGSQALLVQEADDTVQLLDTGIRWEAHGGHFDPANQDPALVDGALDIAAPAPALVGGDHAAVLGTGDGRATVIAIGEEVPETLEAELTIDAADPHQGVAVPLGHELLVSQSDGVAVFDDEGEPVEELADCAAPAGGVALDAGTALVGCEDGALKVEEDAGHFDAHPIASPDGAEGPIGGLAGAPGSGAALGTYPDGAGSTVALVDADAETITPVELPAPVGAIAWDPYWQWGMVLTTDGQLHAIDPESAEIAQSAEVTGEFDPGDGGAAVVAGDTHVYLTNPTSRELVEVAVSRDGFTRERNLALDFAPGDLAVVGLPGLDDEHGEDEEHDEDDHEEEEHGEDDHDH